MCGIFGIFGHPEAPNITYRGLTALQHRGQESAGIVTVACTPEGHPKRTTLRRSGTLSEGFPSEEMATLCGDRAIGHVRYATSGGSFLMNAQPLSVNSRHGNLAVAHNGNILQAQPWREALEQQGALFQSTSDTEILLHLMARSPSDSLLDRVIQALSQVSGAYSILFMSDTTMVAARDPMGFHPLELGELHGYPLFASETCALTALGARHLRTVDPGEVVVVTSSGSVSYFPFPPPIRRAHCLFEHVYFARPDSHVFHGSVYASRVSAGRRLARAHAVAAEIVIPVPDSGIAAAIGYSQESGIPFGMGLIRSPYVGRTFLEPRQTNRSSRVKKKLSPVAELLRDKRVVVVDDSLVRGTTSRRTLQMIREAGAREIHLRIAAPPVAHSCFFGIDTPTREELIASSKGIHETAAFVGCDTLGYLSMEELLQCVAPPGEEQHYCTACFTGEYPQDPWALPEGLDLEGATPCLQHRVGAPHHPQRR